MMNMLTRRRIAVKLCERFRRSFSNSCLYDDHRNFTKQYKDHVMNNKNKDTPSPLLVNYGDGFLQMLTYSSLHTRDDFLGTRRPISVQFPSDFIVCGPCHGLFCLYSIKGEVALWNPATGDLKNLPAGVPSSSDQEEFKVQNVGFGFDSTTNDYKIVRYITRHCFRNNNNFEDKKILHQIQIYGLKSKQWREIPVVGEIISHLPLLSPGSYADGACYWTIPADYRYCIGLKITRLIYFVFAEEEFHIDSLSGAVRYNHTPCIMDALNGFPAAVCYDSTLSVSQRPFFDGWPDETTPTPETATPYQSDRGQKLQVWVWMRDNGVLTWVHQMEIVLDDPIYTPLCLWRNKGLIMFDKKYQLVWYDFEANSVTRTNLSLLSTIQRKMRNRESISTIQVLNFPETLVSNPWE